MTLSAVDSMNRVHVPRLPRSRAERTWATRVVRTLLLASAVLICLGLATTAPAQKPWKQKQRPVVIENDYVRSGFPWEVRRHARPTRTPAYEYGYVGGGAAFNWGQPRTLEQGTWGKDYVGVAYPRAVWMNYWGRARYQGGTGGYKTDGPRLFGE